MGNNFYLRNFKSLPKSSNQVTETQEQEASQRLEQNNIQVTLHTNDEGQSQITPNNFLSQKSGLNVIKQYHQFRVTTKARPLYNQNNLLNYTTYNY